MLILGLKSLCCILRPEKMSHGLHRFKSLEGSAHLEVPFHFARCETSILLAEAAPGKSQTPLIIHLHPLKQIVRHFWIGFGPEKPSEQHVSQDMAQRDCMPKRAKTNPTLVSYRSPCNGHSGDSSMPEARRTTNHQNT